eukprot:CAMPEP_0170776208 /NCGR_PEP_ID=MMETSP0733-20121128/11029_1 /TAXON_ID=186038 /ORGANISM="Fragilariopsis kerguelensis, Strain L26-C5" /LENGTH=162 /DNA_ID=CAMNT_0011119137 /DNA_START=57 /DNA_END=548 /DNA_ORIENTATION=+
MMMPQAMTFFLFCFCLAVLTEGSTLRGLEVEKIIFLGEAEDEMVQEELDDLNEEMIPAMNGNEENWLLTEELKEKENENEELEENAVLEDMLVGDLLDEVNSLKGEVKEMENENEVLTAELNDEDEEVNDLEGEVQIMENEIKGLKEEVKEKELKDPTNPDW